MSFRRKVLRSDYSHLRVPIWCIVCGGAVPHTMIKETTMVCSWTCFAVMKNDNLSYLIEISDAAHSQGTSSSLNTT